MQLPALPKQIVNPLRPLRKKKNRLLLFFLPLLIFFFPSKVVRKIPTHAALLCGRESPDAKKKIITINHQSDLTSGVTVSAPRPCESAGQINTVTKCACTCQLIHLFIQLPPRLPD